MLQNSDFSLLFPGTMPGTAEIPKACQPFDDEAVDFLNSLSACILKDKESRYYPDVVTFAFFCRKANLLQLKKRHLPQGLRLGRGLVFHIAPGNVPVNFAYSLLSALLAGNSSIVKLSSKPFPQVDIIVRQLFALAQNPVSRRIILLRYSHDTDCTEQFSAMADTRVIWGGDNTINLIRKSPLQPRATDICFADRYSICALKADAVLNADQATLSRLSENFYNDTYIFDQNACSAPHLIVWVGNSPDCNNARRIFWKNIHNILLQRYSMQPVLAVDKLTNLYRQAIERGASHNQTPDNLIVCSQLPALEPGIESLKCAGGFFSEYNAESLNEIVPIITKRYQTLAYYGFDRTTLTEFIVRNQPVGIDRIVPIGETSSFSLIWDGIDLISALSREISVL